jgi:VanZ family protein
MKHTKKRLALCYALLTMILAFIWGNSAMPGETSGALSGWLGDLVGKVLPFFTTEQGGHILRKLAHFSEFAALGAVLGWLFGMIARKPLWQRALPLLCGAAAACIDETIQIFSPGRHCSIIDVCIDCSGVLTGTLILTVLYYLICHLKNKNGAE